VDRIAVIGCGGSGKTMLSRRLGELLGLPVLRSRRDVARMIAAIRWL
jgi:adenylate kinase family enzyme